MSCPDCFKGAVHTHNGEPKGTTSTLHGVTCYIASPSPSPASTSPASATTVIYLTDSFGLNLINAKQLADRIATETGHRVLVPDLIPGGGGSLRIMFHKERADQPIAWWNIPGRLRWLYDQAALACLTVRFLFWSSPGAAYATKTLPFARAVRADLAPGAKLGVVGFCWGGFGSTKLCAESAVQGGRERLVDVQFCGHPYDLKTPEMIVAAVTSYKVPFSMAIGDRDRWLSREKVERAREEVQRVIAGGGPGDGCHAEIEIYPGCTHGFVVRAKPGDEVESAAAERARAQAIAWLNKYL